jgi:hypothetical protein
MLALCARQEPSTASRKPSPSGWVTGATLLKAAKGLARV